jgi:AraC-like DNA-binding protein
LGSVATSHRPERSKVELTDAAEIHRALEHAYGAKLRLRMNRTRDGAARVRLARTDAGLFAIDEFDFPEKLEASPDPFNKVAALWVSRGKLSGRCGDLTGSADADEVTLVSQPDLGHHSEASDLAVTAVVLDTALVASVAAGVPIGQAPLPLRFSSFTPVEKRAVQRWKDTVRYVQDCVLADDAIATPLVLGNAGRLLAAVTLTAFHNAEMRPTASYDRNDSQPVLLRRAMEFMESNLASDIGLADIANAVHVTPRAVQYMFRSHLDITPLQYLRRMRLHHAHTDLMAADGMCATVTQIAARWGFAHTGRFAVLYRQTYGQSPHTTLRG